MILGDRLTFPLAPLSGGLKKSIIGLSSIKCSEHIHAPQGIIRVDFGHFFLAPSSGQM